jgi:hypothetical protein
METRPNITGTWYNQHGSTLELEVDEGGRLAGEFRSHTGLAKPSDPCLVTGYAAGDIVAFVVDFSRFGSLTTWAGHRLQEDGAEIIRACWQLAVRLSMKHADEETWRGVWTGEDEFRRVPFGARPSLGRLTSDPFLYWR